MGRDARVMPELTEILWCRRMKTGECFPDFADGRGLPFRDYTLVNTRRDFNRKFDETRDKKSGTLA